ncbi:MFS transporter [Weissella diestrammenae]|uniref:MFS transporter n=1 Tax=Weissella diestrammenae TaxID=1162633 RepID=A0A7G9T6B6_9LACO|nr:MFS transporter [Weissella diestrammenae]MCM0583313.1 MFS transporter [Weissella diestrammenae]QNN75641.1 MFS transporter [Weissella diestrammenae]
MNQTQLSTRRIWLVLLAIGMFTFMSTLDSSIINIALPVISKDLNIPMNQATWSVSIYLIMISGLLTLFGNLGDQMGKIRIFKWGTYVFTFGSMLAGINLGLPFLLFARVVQAIGAAMTMSNSFGISTTIAPQKMRARAMATIAMFVSLGAIAGPAVGGLILSILPWSYIFWINVPLGIVTIILGAFLFPASEGSEEPLSVDWVGVALLFFLITTFFVGLNIGQENGFFSMLPILSYGLTLLLLMGFIYWEQRVSKPLLDLSIFKIKLFTLSILTSFLVFASGFFINVLLPFYLQNLRGVAPGEAGLYMMAYPAAMLIGAPISGAVADKFDRENVTLFALTGITIGMAGWLFIDAHSPLFMVVILGAWTGLGTAFFNSPNNAITMSNAPAAQLGVAGSLNALARNLGMVSGTTAVTTALYLSMSQQIGHQVVTYPVGKPEVFVQGMHFAMVFGLLLVIIAWLLTAYRVVLRMKSQIIHHD